MLKSPILALGFLAVAPLALAACSQAGAPASIDRMAKSEVEAIVKDYLLQNPEVLSEALTALGKHEQGKLFAALLAEGGDPVIGPQNAPITIVEFFDYNCGYCKAATEWVFEQAADKRGDVKVVFKEFPILAESSVEAAKAALAADRQGKYREMHVALMKTRDLSSEGIENVAKSVGLDVTKWKKDMASDGVLIQIDKVMSQAEQAGIQGTPGFFINGEFLNGFNAERLDQIVERARDAAKASEG
jgi:protein-disulfide isomerase